MIYQNKSQIMDWRDLPVASTVETIEEGVGLVHALENGVGVVKPASGSDSEAFVGIAYHQLKAPTTAPRVQEFAVPTGGVKALERTPVGGTSAVLVLINGTKATVGTGTPSAAGEVKLDGFNLIFHADDEAKDVKVVYRHNLTVDEARRLTGDGVIGLSDAVRASGTIGVIAQGNIFTDQYDTGENWAGTGVLKVGANGQFQLDGTGATVAGHVIHVPTEDEPYLGIYFSM